MTVAQRKEYCVMREALRGSDLMNLEEVLSALRPLLLMNLDPLRYSKQTGPTKARLYLRLSISLSTSPSPWRNALYELVRLDPVPLR